MKQKWIGLLLCVLVSSCVREQVIENIIFPAIDSKAAVYCILTPGDSVFVAIKTLQPISDETTDETSSIYNAQVTITNTTTNQKVNLSYSKAKELYGGSQKDLPVLTGNTYQLTIVIPGLYSLKSTCTVPTQAASILTSAYGEIYTETFNKHRRVALSWRDVSSAKTQYDYFVASRFLFKQPFSAEIDTLGGLTLTDEITRSNGMVYYNGDTLDSGYPHTYYLYTSETNLYRFLKMADQMNGIVRRKGTNDFFGAYQGIIPEFTNIENGYGVFGAYLHTQKEIVFQ